MWLLHHVLCGIAFVMTPVAMQRDIRRDSNTVHSLRSCILYVVKILEIWWFCSNCKFDVTQDMVQHILYCELATVANMKSSPTRMWHYSIREWMVTHISISIRSLGSTKTTCTCTRIIMDLTELRLCTYSQREPHDVTMSWVAILAVIQQRHTKAMLRKIRPLVATHLIQQGPTTTNNIMTLHLTMASTSNLAWSQEVLKCVGRERWPNWISYLASWEWTLKGNSTFKNLWHSCQFTCQINVVCTSTYSLVHNDIVTCVSNLR